MLDSGSSVGSSVKLQRHVAATPAPRPGSVGTASASLAVITDEFTSLETAVDSALGVLGADVRSLELQTGFLSDISDATEEGLSDIVDADLARESARLMALQVQQQLAVQTLGIVNSAPQALLALFR